MKKQPPTLISPEAIAPMVHWLRHEKIILDSVLAELYGVEARVLNQAVKRNIERFPADFMFQLTAEEWENLRSQIVTSKNERQSAARVNSSQTVMSSKKHRDLKKCAPIFKITKCDLKDGPSSQIPPLRIHRAGRRHAVQRSTLPARRGGERLQPTHALK